MPNGDKKRLWNRRHPDIRTGHCWRSIDFTHSYEEWKKWVFNKLLYEIIKWYQIITWLSAGFDILVKNCVAHNGAQQKLQLIDSSGWALDQFYPQIYCSESSFQTFIWNLSEKTVKFGFSQQKDKALIFHIKCFKNKFQIPFIESMKIEFQIIFRPVYHLNP